MSKEMSLSDLFSRITRAKKFNQLGKKVLAHPDCNAHSVVQFLVRSSRHFEKKETGMKQYNSWFLPACTICSGLSTDERLLAQLSVEDNMRVLTTVMGKSNEDLYSHLEKLLSQMSLRRQFQLFDRLIRLSRRCRDRCRVYQFSLIYLIENFNVPPKKKGARGLMKFAVSILGRPCPYGSEGEKLMLPSDEVLIAFRRTISSFSK
ncbi:MAG TPA: hypothetical protein P5274_02285 [Candidatus Paceibacterota bacterium]|nr:hypothetical protein [Candidatus Paceibacterota bacterium]